MKQIDYLVDFHRIQNMTIEELKEFLMNKRGLAVSELKISDLIYYKGEPIYSGNGVYYFRKGKDIIYVGNCVARNFVERIPGHFDLRYWGWFNSLLKCVIKKGYDKEVTDELLVEASRDAMENYELILINFKYEDLPQDPDDKVRKQQTKKLLNGLENLLKIVLEPLNKFKHKKIPHGIYKVDEYLK